MLDNFDPVDKENQLREESDSWDTSDIKTANPGDIPIIDLNEYLLNGNDVSLEKIAVELHEACTQVGFCTIVGHQFPEKILTNAFAEAKRFHALADNLKQSILMDRDDWPVKGVGYLPVSHRKLPARSKGNLNESIVFKRDHVAGLEDNQWPVEEDLPGFRHTIEAYIHEMENLSKRLLPIYARALKLDKEFFTPAFTRPLYRMRLTRYPSINHQDVDEYGIAPHVDTTFFHHTGTK